MNKIISKNLILRCTSIILILFAFIFSVTFEQFFSLSWENGYCIGDNILNNLGLQAWSNGTSGTHYTVLYSFIMLIIAFIIYSISTKNKALTFSYFISAFCIIFILSNIML